MGHVFDSKQKRQCVFLLALVLLHRTWNMAELVVSFATIVSMAEKQNGAIIDVREPHELQETGRIPSSINIPLAELTTALQLTPDKFLERYKTTKPALDDQDIVFTCRSGKRASTAQTIASQLGYTRTKIYSGSMLDYLEQKGPLQH